MMLLPKSEHVFMEALTGKLFKILPLYEEDADVIAYVDSLLIQLKGFSDISSLGLNIDYLNIVATLQGLAIELPKQDNHKVVKREVFKLISINRELVSYIEVGA